MKRPFFSQTVFFWGMTGFLLGMAVVPCSAEEVQINGDTVEYVMKYNKVIAEGHVSVEKEGVTLLCDRLEYYRDTQIAIAQGNVVLIRGGERIVADRMKFNYATMKGDFEATQFFAQPFYGTGKKVAKVGENHLRLEQGYLTTSDFDKPEFRFAAKRVDVYPGDRAVARHVRLMMGNVPILYIPKFVQDLRDNKPAVSVTPGQDSEWGTFFLTTWRFHLTENIKGKIHLDYRQRLDLAEGFDLDYDTERFGDGVIRTYYTHERRTSRRHFFDEQLEPTVERERYRIEWRHKWEIDEDTLAIMQYSLLSDRNVLDDFFEKVNRTDANPNTFFSINRVLPAGSLNIRSDVRINRFESKVERLPQIQYTLPSEKIGDTQFYFSNTTAFANLVNKSAAPSEDRTKTFRIHTENSLSYPLKIAFIELTPSIGGTQTYYSRTKNPEDYNSVRTQFKTGASLSTKFFRIFEVETDRWGLDINRLRHVISPSVSYSYTTKPSLTDNEIDQFDSVDSLGRSHGLTFALDSKLQTKRDGKSVDLVRFTSSTGFNLKEAGGKGGFNTVKGELEVSPYSWLQFYFESTYDTISRTLNEYNIDLYLRKRDDPWYFNLSKRFNGAVDDQITTEFGFRPNHKWRFRAYQQYDINTGTLKEQDYTLRRDLHAWYLDINFNQTRGEGNEIRLIFTLKAFPDITLDAGTSFKQRKPGSQSP